MRMRAVLLFVLAAALGVTAVFLFRNYLADQLARRPAPADQVAAAPEMGKIVVAAVPLRFGNRLGAEHLKEVDWPSNSLPDGAFASSEQLLTGEPRVVLYAMQPNEPVLANKITGPGQRASLSALVEEGMRAVTIRVNDVLGVAGFVLPGDRVDILLTRQISEDNPITDVLLQNVRVLGIDQLADEQREDPMVVKAVTLEVTTEQAQKLTLAATVGSLGLALRGVAYVDTEKVQRIDISDLNVGEAIKPEKSEAPVAEKKPARKVVRTVPRPDPNAKVGITRGLVRQEYEVKPEAGLAPRTFSLSRPSASAPAPAPTAATPPSAPVRAPAGAATGEAPAKSTASSEPPRGDGPPISLLNWSKTAPSRVM